MQDYFLSKSFFYDSIEILIYATQYFLKQCLHKAKYLLSSIEEKHFFAKSFKSRTIEI